MNCWIPISKCYFNDVDYIENVGHSAAVHIGCAMTAEPIGIKYWGAIAESNVDHVTHV